MDAFIKKWGNSPAVRLPTAVLKEAGYQLEQQVRLKVSEGCIIIEPVRRVEYDLDDLVNAITPENAHAEIDVGPPLGKETL